MISCLEGKNPNLFMERRRPEPHIISPASRLTMFLNTLAMNFFEFPEYAVLSRASVPLHVECLPSSPSLALQIPIPSARHSSDSISWLTPSPAPAGPVSCFLLCVPALPAFHRYSSKTLTSTETDSPTRLRCGTCLYGCITELYLAFMLPRPQMWKTPS